MIDLGIYPVTVDIKGGTCGDKHWVIHATHESLSAVAVLMTSYTMAS